MKVFFSSLDRNRSLGGWQETAVYIEEALREAEIDFSVIRPPNPARISECDIFYEGTWVPGVTKKNFNTLRARSPEAVFILQLINAHPDTYYHIYQDELRRFGLRDERFDASWVRAFRVSIAEADVIFCHSEWIKESLAKNRKPESAIRVVPKGVNIHFWKPVEFPRKVFRVGFAGQLQVIKGLQYLFRAWKQLQYASSSAELWVAGPKTSYIVHGRRSWACGEIFNEHLSSPGIVYKGWYRNRTDLRNFYNALDVFVAPSLEDGWNMTVVEAMACCKPVVVTTTTGMAQIIEDGVNGFVIHPGDVDEIASKIEWFRTHPDETTRMGIAARKTVLGFDVATYKRNFISAIRSCLGIRSEFTVNSPAEWTQKQVSMFKKEFFLSARQRVTEGQPIIKVLIDVTEPGSKVLDVGCLDGSVSALLQEQGREVVACDLPEVAQEARDLHPELTIVDIDLNDDFPVGEFDVVFASGVIEHLYNDFFFLCNCYKALEPNGTFIVSSVGFDDWCPLHLRIYPERQFRSLLTMAGFTHVDFSHSDGQRLVAVAKKVEK